MSKSFDCSCIASADDVSYTVQIHYFTVVLNNEVREVLQRHYLLRCHSANVPLDFCTVADFEIKYFSNEDTAF